MIEYSNEWIGRYITDDGLTRCFFQPLVHEPPQAGSGPEVGGGFTTLTVVVESWGTGAGIGAA